MFNFFDSLKHLSRIYKQFIVAIVDFISVTLSILIGFFVTDNLITGFTLGNFVLSLYLSTSTILFFFLFGVYRSVLRFVNFSVILLILRSIIFSFFIYYLSIEIFVSSFGDSNYLNLIDNLGLFVSLLTSIILIITSRIFAFTILTHNLTGKRIVIYGAGAAGIQLASALKVSPELKTVAFIDNDKSLHNTYLGGIKVISPSDLSKLVTRDKVDEVLIAIPSAPKSILNNLLKEVEDLQIKVRILPGLTDLAQGKILVSELKEVDVSDILGRYEVEADQSLINKNIRNKVVLITGAGGSIGSEISRQVAKNEASKVILLDSNEYALYSIKREIESFETEIQLYAVLATVNNRKRIIEVCKTFKVDTIYHTAAYKHVPMVEENPFEAVYNNIHGTKICAQAAIEAKVETFVLISTDKAVRPTNIMGATKRFSELILQSLSSNPHTRMTMVRFGNVIGSSGSAIPLFQQQIKDGGPVTVTHPEVIRYFMSIPEAAELVIQAGAMGKGGDVFVLDMGEPVRIYDLAKRLINLSGMDVKDDANPEGDIEIIFTGLRPGEKLYEELLIGDNVSTTEHKQILRAEEDFLSINELEKYFDLLEKAEKDGNVNLLREVFKKVISGFTPSEEIVDVVYQQRTE